MSQRAQRYDAREEAPPSELDKLASAAEVPTVTFETPNHVQAEVLTRACESWGLAATRINHRVAVTGETRHLATLWGLFGSGQIEHLQRGRIQAADLAHCFADLTDIPERG